jgi:hypothetical protein
MNMAKQVQPITERQLDLITRAHGDAGGLIEPLLTLKGGAKLKMIASLAQRDLIAQVAGQWRITPKAIAFVTGGVPDAQDAVVQEEPRAATETDTTDPMDKYDIPTFLATPPAAASTSFELDTDTEAGLATQEAQWQAEKQVASRQSVRANSKLALMLDMLRQPQGASIEAICQATGWQAHSVRGTFAATLKKKMGLAIASEKVEVAGRRQRVYRLDQMAA